MKRVRVVASGRVQGVFYRVSCARLARGLGLTGYVRNLPDGRVEAAFVEGELVFLVPSPDRLDVGAHRGAVQGIAERTVVR